MNSHFTIKNLHKKFGAENIFVDFNLSIEKEKITVIFGPNGCGKSTLLNILAGIHQSDSGQHNLETGKYNLSYIFQNYRESLLPWADNFKNVAFPLVIQNKTTTEINEKITELEQIFNFTCHKKQYPYQLSGGQQQIISMMRALASEPKILLIDEPFSALDYENNLFIRDCLQKYYLKYQPTILLITHNIEEAAHLAQNIVVLSKKPSKVISEIKNLIPYPRSTETLKTEELAKIKHQILNAFELATGNNYETP